MFRICRIISETEESSNKLKKYLGGYPVEITIGHQTDEYYEVPTLMIGWNTVKNNYPSQKINNEEVVKNLFWTYNEDEFKEILGGDGFLKTIENFVNKNIKSWLPSQYILFDSLMHGSFSNFINTNIDNNKITYIHFNKGALYMRNGNNNFIINVKILWITEPNYRNTITEVLNNLNCIVYSYNHIEEYIDLDELRNIRSLDIIRWIKFGIETPIKYFQIIPNIDISKYIPFMMSMIPIHTLELDKDEEVFFERMCVRDKATRWMSTRYVSFDYSFNKNLNFIYRDNTKLAQINYSTKKTITGRIVCDDRYNPQNLSKEGDDRAKIISRFRNGRIYQFDYTSFEARIALYLTNDEEFIQDYYDKDIHSETAIIIFETHDFTPEQREVAKLANMAIMYGASEDTAMKLLSKYPEPDEKLRKIKLFLEPIFRKAKEIIEESNRNGYLINKWGSIIRPEKNYAAFNNYLQSTASEIVIDKVLAIKELLRPYRSQFLFQVHDSLVFDVHPEEIDIVQVIAKTLSYNKGMMFSVNYKSGPNYKDLSSEFVYF